MVILSKFLIFYGYIYIAIHKTNSMQNLSNFRVTKYSGDIEPFNPNSLKSSLKKSGANIEEVQRVYREIEDKVYDGITTSELYELAFASLKNQRESYAARYSLKKALRDLGPDGYYFEQWVSKLFEDNGYKAVTGQTVQGHAVSHEIDVVAMNDKSLLAIECKFRNDPEARISVTTPMYFMSRLKDIQGIPCHFFGQTKEISDGLLVTNAYFTSDSISFAKHYGLPLLSWDYPKGNAIKERVDNISEYPITCLTTLTKQDKEILLKRHHCILVKDILQDPAVLEKIQISSSKKKRILLEATDLVATTEK